MKAWIALAALLLAAPAAAQEIAITFDDLPVHSDLPPGETRLGVAARIVAALADAKAPPTYGFVNAGAIGEPGTTEVLDVWRAAGHPLGNHTWAHLHLTDAAAFEAEIVRNEPALQARGGDWRWLRYPFLEEGAEPVRGEVRRRLAGRGYKIASVTLTFDDYAWNGPYARCAARGDAASIAALEESWLAAADASLAYERDLARRLYGWDVPYVLLMHVGAFDARMLPRLLALYRQRGVQLVTLEQAMADPFYRDDRASAASPAPATLEAAARARGVSVPPRTWDISRLDGVCR